MTVDTTTLRSRRALLLGALGGLGAVAAQAIRPLATSAADGDPVMAGQDTASSTAMVVTSTAPQAIVGRSGATAPSNNKVPSGVVGIVFNAAGNNFTDAPSGVLGIASHGTGFNLGVQGIASSASGIGVVGRATNGGDNAVGVYGESKGPNGAGVKGVGAGIAVYGQSTGAASTGVQGDGHLHGVAGYASDAAGIGVYGYAQSSGGRGGSFTGKSAQVRLEPSAASTHPHSGKPGDLFVDKSHRLWFCKGGSTWVKLA
jgi:hypothetical protein